MPKKSRRVAVRQAELGQRKRRTGKQPLGEENVIPLAPSSPPTQVETRGAAAPQQTPSAQETSRRVSLERPSPATPPSTANLYLWPELRRIGLISGLMLVILAAVTVLLR